MECTSGRRFDETAGDDLAGTCVPGPEGCEGWNTRYFRACGLPPPSGNLTFNGFYSYDTTNGTLTDALTMATIPQPSIVIDGVRYLSVQDVMVAASSNVRIVGDYPLVIAAWGSMMIAGKIDAGGRTMQGPGTNPPECTANEARPGADRTPTEGGGGGGGGGFSGKGGAGGGTRGGAGGTAVTAPPQTIRAGCNGAHSGNAGSEAAPPATADTHASGGKGGGAIVLSARLSLTMSGEISATGEGGGGSPMGAQSGGAGGGSGGLIVLESPVVEAHGTLVATGGSGGGVALETGMGQKGRDGTLTGALGAAAGNNCAGTGGTGSSTTSADGGAGAGAATCGGAGGGGGSGWILVFAENYDDVGLMAAPVPSHNPF